MNYSTLIPVLLLALTACGKDKGGGGGGAGATAGGPACADAAAAYVKTAGEQGGNKIYSLKPNADESKIVVAKLEADCTARNWSSEIKTCMVNTKPALGKDCGEDKMVLQAVHDVTTEIKAARPPAAGSAQ